MESVEIRARVSGYLQSVHFEDGALVKRGDLLFVIDPRPYEAALDEARADLTQAKVRLELASNDLDRAKRLFASRAISEEELDARTKEHRQAEASLEAAQAAEKGSALNLEFARIKAPISGRIGRKLVTVGNLVSSSGDKPTLLTTIVSVDPIHVYFTADERAFLRYTRLAEKGIRPSSRNTPNPVRLQLADEQDFPHQGHMDFVDNQVDRATGTMQGRAIFANPDGEPDARTVCAREAARRGPLRGADHPRPGHRHRSGPAAGLCAGRRQRGHAAPRHAGTRTRRTARDPRRPRRNRPGGDQRHTAHTARYQRDTRGRQYSGACGRDFSCSQPMNFSHFFIDRPRFAAVVSILITIVGAIAYLGLPVTQYPDVVPPTIIVTASYPGATPEVIADTVAAPLEQEINGVEGMLYLTSSSTSDGRLTLTITFELGTDLDAAQVLVQNRVAIAEPRLPEEVRRIGVVTQKSSPDLMIVVHLESPDNSLDQLYISNYALLQIRDVLARINGVGQINLVGAREYSMRIWLDPDRMAALQVTADDVVTALRGQNIQVAGGTLGEQPSPASNAFQVSISSQGRLLDTEQFGQVIVKSGEDGRLTRVADIARVELGARDYLTNSLLDGRPAVAIVMFQRPGSNALETAEEVKQTMARLATGFPKGLVHRIVYNPTDFIAQSVDAVYITLLEATALVIIVILLFLQNWRAAMIPVIAIPVSLVGTFGVMAALGYSLNNLTLFGLVLAIGIVVDDAIVVVESIERNLENGLSAREASRRTMTEVGTALVSIALVLVAVFLPTAFLGGITGQFFRQFAVTIATATAISALVSLTLSPALGAILLRRHDAPLDRIDRGLERLLGGVFRGFNRGFDQPAGKIPAGRLPGRAPTRPRAVSLCRDAGPDGGRLCDGADRLHSAAGPGLPDHAGRTPEGCIAGPDHRRHPAGHGDRTESTGPRTRRGLRRFFSRNQLEFQSLRHRVHRHP